MTYELCLTCQYSRWAVEIWPGTNNWYISKASTLEGIYSWFYKTDRRLTCNCLPQLNYSLVRSLYRCLLLLPYASSGIDVTTCQKMSEVFSSRQHIWIPLFPALCSLYNSCQQQLEVVSSFGIFQENFCPLHSIVYNRCQQFSWAYITCQLLSWASIKCQQLSYFPLLLVRC